jgi:hypothetical protein
VQVQSTPVFVGELTESVGIPGQGSGKPRLIESRADVSGHSITWRPNQDM